MEKVKPGDPLRLPAEFVNRTIDALGLAEQRDLSQPLAGRIAAPDIVHVYNPYIASSYVFPALTPVGLSGYASQTADAMASPVFLGVLDSSVPQWGVCLDRIAPGEVGRVQVSGVATSRVIVTDPAHRYVSFGWSALGGRLESAAESGESGAQLLGYANGFGTVLLGGRGGGANLSERPFFVEYIHTPTPTIKVGPNRREIPMIVRVGMSTAVYRFTDNITNFSIAPDGALHCLVMDIYLNGDYAIYRSFRLVHFDDMSTMQTQNCISWPIAWLRQDGEGEPPVVVSQIETGYHITIPAVLV